MKDLQVQATPVALIIVFYRHMSETASKTEVRTHLLGQEKTIQGQSYPKENVSEYIDGVLSSIGFGLFQVIAFVLTAIVFIAYGYAIMTFAIISVDITNKWNISNLVYASVPAATSIANIIGEIVIGVAADKYGRLWPYVISLFIVAIFVAASAFAPTFAVFGVLQNIASIGIGGTLVIRIPFLMEFLPGKYIGVVSTSISFIEGLARCVAAGLAWWLVPRYSSGWRYFILCSSVPFFITAISLMFFLESPRYLVTHNKPEKAWRVFSIMARINGKTFSDIVTKDQFVREIDELFCQHVSKEGPIKKSTAWIFAMFNKQFLRRTICFCFIIGIVNCVSNSTTLFLPNYLTTLRLNPYYITLIGLVSELPGRALIPIIVEWPEFGRRNTLRIFFLLSVVCFLLFGFVQNEIATPVLIVFVYFSLVPTSGLTTTFISESYPTEMRITALSFLCLVDGVNSTWFPFVAGHLTDISKEHTWVSPSCSAAIMLIPFTAAMFINHETRGKPLEDVIKTQPPPHDKRIQQPL